MIELIGILFGAGAGIAAAEVVDYLRRESPSKVIHVFRSYKSIGRGEYELIEKRRTLSKGWFGDYEWTDETEDQNGI